MRRRVVFHVPSMRGGGAERVWVLMANELAARGHDVTLFTWNAEGPNAALRAPNVRLVDLGLPVHNDRFGKAGSFRGLVRSIAVLRRLRPDALYSAPAFANTVMAVALTLAGSRARFFPSIHAAAGNLSDGFGADLSIRVSRLMAGRARKVIAVSRGVGKELKAQGIPADKVAVINNPVPAASTDPSPALPLDDDIHRLGDGPVIATAGRLVAVKDHATLLRAFALLIQNRPARLVIFGEGPLRDELQMLSQSLGISQRVLFAGYVEAAHIYARADLFVLSSLSEGFGNVLVEAMGAGVPVVSTDCPHGPREILADGAFGELVPVGDAAAMAEAMGRALDAPPAAAKLKQRAADFAVARIGDQYEALLDA